MRRIFHAVLLGLATLSIGAQAQTNRVQTIADVSFAVPDGWAYQAAADFGGMAYKEGTSFWFFWRCTRQCRPAATLLPTSRQHGNALCSTRENTRAIRAGAPIARTRCPRRRAIRADSTIMPAHLRWIAKQQRRKR